ncbi:histidine phosphatase family protein [Reinekea sp.]|jgi:probable phosphoglycerate mutase|uniref:histidine phosphatase family protein n=1 Tax=Reinekea sp. TaxID=1970455 RepID=UPI002A805588|nr:histidine phosphatase family protein [Reinekea sp.]
MKTFKNSYLLMRHGESEANVAGLIVSDPAIGCTRFGLTEHGRMQVVVSATRYAGKPINAVICSDFLRTTQTANLLVATLALPMAQIDIGLRERFFGDWEGKSDDHYPDIWRMDQDPERQMAHRIETVERVRQRGLKVIEKLEQARQNEVIILVSHGDMLQILLTAFVGKAADQHRSLAHHAQADIKALVTRTDL